MIDLNREEVIKKENRFEIWHETNLETHNKGKIRIMSDVKPDTRTDLEKEFDINFEQPPEKGKPCHMQVDEDLHTFLNRQRHQLDIPFRKLANELLCKGIQQYIKAKKLNITIRNRSK